MKIYITRHGRTIWNDEGRLQGFLDSPLTQEGIDMAKSLSDKIGKYDIKLIVSSDLKRAKDTATYIKSDRDIPIFYFKELREMSFGDWDGMKLTDIYENYSESFNKFETDPLNYDNGSGETYHQLIKRVKKILEQIKHLGYESTLIVTHGITAKALQILIENQDFENISKLPVIKGCTLIGYEITDGKVEKIIKTEEYDFIPK